MQPLIAKYTDFSAASVHGIQEKFVPLKSYKKKRVYKEVKEVPQSASSILIGKAPNKYSVRPLFIVDSNAVATPTVKSKNTRPCSAKKPQMDNKSTQPPLNWDFKPISRHRENWLYSLVKPETEFNKKDVKKIPVSLGATLIKNAIERRAGGEENIKHQEEKIGEQVDKEEEVREERDGIANEEVREREPINEEETAPKNEECGKPKSVDSAALEKYFNTVQPLNPQFLSEYKSQFQQANTTKALKEIRKAYNLN